MRIAIVNDLPFVAKLLRRVVTLKPEHQIAWVAENGAEAVQHCAQDKPDLILMDLRMPEMDGVEATRQIMAQSPCAILIVTFSVETNTAQVFEALGAGALDAVDTPADCTGTDGNSLQPLLKKIDIIGRLLGETPRRISAVPPLASNLARSSGESLIAIGASAGGPHAVARVLGSLPRPCSSAIVVVQHVDAQFSPGLAQWLGEQTRLPVQLAKPGDQPRAGTVLLAGTNDHLVFADATTLSYVREPIDASYRPSVDVFFHSVIPHWRGPVAGVLLTGMGRDGAEGLRALRDAGFHTIAQDRASCSVYGMPKAAAEMDAAAEILPLEKIGPRLGQLFAVTDFQTKSR